MKKSVSHCVVIIIKWEIVSEAIKTMLTQIISVLGSSIKISYLYSEIMLIKYVPLLNQKYKFYKNIPLSLD